MDPRETARRIAALEETVRLLQTDLAHLPVRWPGVPPRTSKVVLVDGNQSSGTTNQFRYGFKEAELTATGWTEKSGGLQVAASNQYAAWNRMEAINSGTGQQCNGFDYSDVPFGADGTTITVLPIPDGVPVTIEKIPIVGATASPYYRWEIVSGPTNGIDGECA